MRRLWRRIKLWLRPDYSVRTICPFIGDALRAHRIVLTMQRHAHLANVYELQRQQTEQDFNIVNETRQRMLSINRGRQTR